MNSQERLLGALRRKSVDRVPVVFRIGLQYLEKELIGPIAGNPSTRLQTDLLDRLVGVQEDLGLDPVIYPHWWHGMFISSWPSAIFSWPEDASKNWRITRKVDRERLEVEFRVDTPGGPLLSTCKYSRDQKWAVDYLIKEERQLELLHFRPDPMSLDASRLADIVGKLGNRGIVNFIYPGAWDEALHLRGMTNLITDLYDRPDWVKEFLHLLTDYSVAVLERICRMSGLHCVMNNDSYIGLVSPRTYDEFIAVCDREMVAAVKRTGAISDLHNCGKTNHLLERMVDAGPHSIETLTPPAVSSGGDIELADAKRRVGGRVCLMGGFNERVLSSDNADDVRSEARRCLSAAKTGGGYVLHAAGQIFDAKKENFDVLLGVVREYGTYN